jgi:hypothetical protein
MCDSLEILRGAIAPTQTPFPSILIDYRSPQSSFFWFLTLNSIVFEQLFFNSAVLLMSRMLTFNLLHSNQLHHLNHPSLKLRLNSKLLFDKIPMLALQALTTF